MQYDAALENYTTALSYCDREDLTLHIRLSMADIYRRSGRLETSVLETLDIENRFGCCAKARLVRGLAEQALGRHDDAIELFRDVTANHEDEPLAPHYLGAALLEAGRYVEAQDVFESIIDRKGGGAWFQLAVARAAQGDQEGMFDALAKAKATERRLLRSRILEEPAFAAWMHDARFDGLLHELFDAPVAAL